ncbi:hypothetical protein SAMN05216548_1327 [Faunimonas pinastri]|uniref:Cell wall anchor protein n=1 Tax=Faunimonas pinastri TaxID=1855383 RepID=A0A1H9QQ81_9HYPH|nr:cell wall anchor protein [Faunimonas pinastri]SER62666.1 hypothetical protein SAMN05216548_1327 [Faunimonas pinastri]
MKLLACAALGVAVIAGGCSTSTTDKIDSTIQKSLPQICALASTAHVTFATVATTGKLSSKVVDDEAAAWAGMTVLCNDTTDVSTSTALTKAATVYATITKSLTAAKAAE